MTVTGRHRKAAGTRRRPARHRLAAVAAAAALCAGIAIPALAATRYTVKPGDTLSGIAQRYLGSASLWPQLYAKNHGTIGGNPNLIFPGERLMLPGTVRATVDRTQTMISAPASHGSIVADVYAVYGAGAPCALEILNHESGTSWADVTISNPYSGAYGLPQALPGYKMASAGADWRTNPVTQLIWQRSYVNQVYGGVCNAAHHDLSTGTY